MGWNGLVSENSIIFFMTTAKRNLPSECNGIVGRPGISAARWRALIPAYQLVTPQSLSEALTIVASDDGTWKPLAGGTDLMVLLEAGKLAHKNYVDIWNLKELRGIEVNPDYVTLGALTTYTEVQ